MPSTSVAPDLSPARLWTGEATGTEELPTVLVVDDFQSSREALAELLQAEYHVVLAETGREALQKAIRYLPDVILLDVMLPVMNGFEVLRRLKADSRTADIAVIFASGLDRSEDQARGFQLGGVDYITKPFDLRVLAARVRVHARAARKNRFLEQLTGVDPLTGLWNRRHFDQEVAAECSRSQRSGQPLSVALLDVDGFSQFNDRHGPAAGHQALCHIAGILRAGMHRMGDVAARYGGDEFALILIDTDLPNAVVLLQSLHRAINTAGAGLTACSGIASASTEGGFDAEALIQVAATRLQRAKGAGRNVVMGDVD